MSADVLGFGAADEISLLEGCSSCGGGLGRHERRIQLSQRRAGARARARFGAVKNGFVRNGFSNVIDVDAGSVSTASLRQRLSPMSVQARRRTAQLVRQVQGRGGQFTRGAASLAGLNGIVADQIQALGVCNAPSGSLRDLCNRAGLDTDECQIVQCALDVAEVDTSDLNQRLKQAGAIEDICAALFEKTGEIVPQTTCRRVLRKLVDLAVPPPPPCPSGTVRNASGACITVFDPTQRQKQDPDVLIQDPPTNGGTTGTGSTTKRTSTGVKVAIGAGAIGAGLFILPRLFGR